MFFEFQIQEIKNIMIILQANFQASVLVLPLYEAEFAKDKNITRF